MSEKEKADFYREYDLDFCRKQKSMKPEAFHQKETINKLNEWFKLDEFPSGSVVALPTGSGKTFTAVRFLCKYVLGKDYKVLWLAHTHHLLEQAFYSFGPLSEKINEGYEVGWIPEPKEKLNVRIVSGTQNHFNINNISSSDDIVIATLQSIVNADKKNHLNFKEFLKSANNKLFIVFDEAHHSPAPSYRNLMLSLRKKIPEMHLLGLTATPTHMDINKRVWLKELFPQEIVHQTPVKDLMANGILAKPIIKEPETDFTPDFDERTYLRWVNSNKDLPNKIVTQLAKNTARNQKIAQYYIENKDLYKKSIIFADRYVQCNLIKDLLVRNGIAADVMYSQQGNERNAEVLDKFRKNELDVIVNIKMLTEGTDVPDVDTVFVTRQTTSIISMTQMVGRALRGPKFGGKSDAYLVFFQDDWQKAINWVIWDTKTWGPVAPEDEYESEDETTEKKKRIPIFDFIIPYLYDLIDSNKVQPFLTLMPIGWYKVSIAIPDEDGNPEEVEKLVMVFENEKDSFDKLILKLKGENLEEFDDEYVNLNENKGRLKKWHKQFFLESDKHVLNVLKNICDIARHMAQNMKEPPIFVEFKERKTHDLDIIAQKFIDDNLPTVTIDENLYSEYNREDRFWKVFYYDYGLFKSHYNECVEWILYQTRGINKIIENKENEFVKKLKTGSSEDKIEACHVLGDMGLEELLHNKTITLLKNIAKSDDDLNVRKAAEKAVDLIDNLMLSYEDKDKIKGRDGFKCLCCGEEKKNLLQVDHIKPRWHEVDNTENNLQTLCKICNIFKSTDTIDFRNTITELIEPPKGFPGLNKIDLLQQSEVRSLNWWDKFLKRNINFFYQCHAVKSLNIDADDLKWVIYLNNGNQKSWLDPFMGELILKIQNIHQEFGYTGPKDILIENINTPKPPISNKECSIYINRLKNGNDHERAHAARKLGKLRCINSVGALIKALNDKDYFVPKASAISLGKIGDKRAIKPLIRRLSSKKPDLRISAKNALILIGDPSIEELIITLKNKNIYARQLAVEVLQTIKNEKTIDILIETLKDEDSTVRWRAARALGKFNSYKAVKPLQEALNDSDDKVKEESSASLSKMSEKINLLFEKLDIGIKNINDEIIRKKPKNGYSYFTPKMKFLTVYPLHYRIENWLYIGNENIKGVKKFKHNNIGKLTLENEEQLNSALEIFELSYNLRKEYEEKKSHK